MVICVEPAMTPNEKIHTATRMKTRIEKWKHNSVLLKVAYGTCKTYHELEGWVRPFSQSEQHQHLALSKHQRQI
jgi:hypothetical protein